MIHSIHAVVACLLTLIALLYQIECDSGRWKATETAVILTRPEQVAQFISYTDSANKWFQWVSRFRELDSRAITKGKKYEAEYDMPVIGKFVMLFHLVELKPNQVYVLESESYLKPRFTISLEPTKEFNTKFSLSLEFRRTSALYHITLGPLFWLLSSEQLRHSLLVLKMMLPF